MTSCYWFLTVTTTLSYALKKQQTKTNRRKLFGKQQILAHQILLNQKRSLGTQQNVTIFSQYLYFQPR